MPAPGGIVSESQASWGRGEEFLRAGRLPTTVGSTGAKALSRRYASEVARVSFAGEVALAKSVPARTLGNLTLNDSHSHLTLHEPSADFLARTVLSSAFPFRATRYTPLPPGL
jgi:hypothetical protein